MHVTRRDFLRHISISSMGLAVAPWLPGCGDGRSSGGAGHMDGPGRVPATDTPGEVPWWLQGNYAPVDDEVELEQLTVEGALPPGLSGLYVRNGPNPAGQPGGHWFFGDGMLHGLWFEGGSARVYRNRYIRTAQLEKGRAAAVPDRVVNAGNTNLVQHAGRLLTLYEVGWPHEVRADDLSTVGVYNFSGALEASMTAHPKVDPVTGEMLFFSYDFQAPYLRFFRVNPDGALVHSAVMEIPQPTMQHEFQITENYVLFYDQPLVFDLSVFATEGMPYTWRPALGARIGVMPRAGDVSELRWLDIEPGSVFHSFNAYEDPLDGQLVFDAVRHDFMWVRGDDGEPLHTRPRPHRYRIDLEAGRVSEQSISDTMVEFSVFDSRRQGLPYRHGYGVRVSSPEEEARGDTRHGLRGYDLQSGEMVEYLFPEGQKPDEHVFVPDGEAAGENEGWLMGFTYDAGSDTSDLTVLDATDIPAGPIARVKLGRRVPFGFHGQWLPAG